MGAAGGEETVSTGSPPSQAGGDPAREAAQGDALFLKGDFAGAGQRYREAARLAPLQPDYHYRLGLAAWRSGRTDAAEHHFLEAIRLAPNFAAAHEALGLWCQEAGQIDRALAHTDAARRADPASPDVAVSRAMVLLAAGRAREAWDGVQPLLESVTAATSAGSAAANIAARLAQLYVRLAPRMQLGPEQERQAMSLLEWCLRSPEVAPAIKPALRFTLIPLLERAGRYDEAFEQARLAKEATRRPFDPAVHAYRISRQVSYFTPQRLRCLPRSTLDTRRAVLIVGMPRSGTSLVEQILDSHPAVFGGGELPTLPRIINGLRDAPWSRGVPYPDGLDGLSLRDADALARQYLSALESLPGLKAKEEQTGASAGGAPLMVTDKLPQNFLALGLAQLILPGCRVIHCVRNPLDTCLSCYMTDFAGNQEFSNDLAHLGSYFREYHRLMTHWRKALSLPILDVRYEELVLDVEGQGRRMLDFLDLPWDERCARFYESLRPVQTASRDQVRRPAYLSSVGRWKHYEKHLGELIEAIGGLAGTTQGKGR